MKPLSRAHHFENPLPEPWYVPRQYAICSQNKSFGFRNKVDGCSHFPFSQLSHNDHYRHLRPL